MRKRTKTVFFVYFVVYTTKYDMRRGGNGLHLLFSDARHSEVLTLLQIYVKIVEILGFWCATEAPSGWRATPSEFPRKLINVINLRKARQRVGKVSLEPLGNGNPSIYWRFWVRGQRFQRFQRFFGKAWCVCFVTQAVAEGLHPTLFPKTFQTFGTFTHLSPPCAPSVGCFYWINDKYQFSEKFRKVARMLAYENETFKPCTEVLSLFEPKVEVFRLGFRVGCC